MVKQPYRGGVGWDMKEFPESDLHVYGRDDTKIVVYNMGRYTKRGRSGKNQAILEQDCELLYNFIDQQDNII